MKASSEFKLTVPYDRSCKDLFDKLGYNHTGPQKEMIYNIPIVRYEDKVCAQLFMYYNSRDINYIVSDIVKNGYRPATAFETMTFGLIYPKVICDFNLISPEKLIYHIKDRNNKNAERFMRLRLPKKRGQLKHWASLGSYDERDSFTAHSVYLGVRADDSSQAPVIDISDGHWQPMRRDLKFLAANINPATGNHIIDTDHYPLVPSGKWNPYVVNNHIQGGLREITKDCFSFFPHGSTRTIGKLVPEILASNLIPVNSNTAHYMIEHNIVPDECKDGSFIFLGTEYENDNNMQYFYQISYNVVNKKYEIDIMQTCNPLYADYKILVWNNPC